MAVKLNPVEVQAWASNNKSQNIPFGVGGCWYNKEFEFELNIGIWLSIHALVSDI